MPANNENEAKIIKNAGSTRDEAIRAYQKVLDLLAPAAGQIKEQIKREIARLEKQH